MLRLFLFLFHYFLIKISFVIIYVVFNFKLMGKSYKQYILTPPLKIFLAYF